MSKSSVVYMSCAFSMLLASGTVFFMGRLYEPSKSANSDLLKKLKIEAQCAECGYLKNCDSIKCEKCCEQKSISTKVTGFKKSNATCVLSKDTKDVILQNIEAKLYEEKWIEETIDRAAKKENTTRNLNLLAKNVPLPTAHWILSDSHKEPVLTHWRSKTGSGYALSNYGVKATAKGEMNVLESGFYMIYLQMDFINVTTQKFNVTVEVKGEDGIVTCLKLMSLGGQSSERTNLTLRKQLVFHLGNNENLRVAVAPSNHAMITTTNNSHFGLYLVRKTGKT